MAARKRRDYWRKAWDGAVADVTLAALLLTLAAALAMAATVPQIPGRDAIERARTLSSLHVRYGSLASLFDSLGLLTITQSWGFRALLSLTACCILLRSVEIVGRLSKPGGNGWPECLSSSPRSWIRTAAGADSIAFGCHIGAILVVAGLAITQVWGWEMTAVALQGNGPVSLRGPDAWIAYGDGGRIETSTGIQIRDVDWGPGIKVRALGPEDELLQLRQRPNEAPAAELKLALTRDPDLGTRDALFTIPQANLIIRVAPLPLEDGAPGGADQFLVQAFRSPSGDLAAEEIVHGRATVPVREAVLEIDSTTYALVTAGYSPGRWPAMAGLAVLLASILATVARQAIGGRRLTHVTLGSDPDGIMGKAADSGMS